MGVKVLHLVLYSKSDCYDKMMAATRKLYRLFDAQVATFYYHRDESVKEVTINDSAMLMSLPGKESYMPGILEKTLQAFDYCDANFEGFDVLVRSNISTVVNFRVLLPLLEQQFSPPSIADNIFYYGGPFVLCSDSVSSKNPYLQFMPLSFVQGTCIILSKTCLKFILEHSQLMNREIDDDPSIALLLKQQKGIFPQLIGHQYAFYNPRSNFDEAVTVRHHHFGSDRKQDVSELQTTSQIIALRTLISEKTQEVSHVLYHTTDVTEKIILICKVCTVWKLNTGDNIVLDDLFSDPLPGVYKQLTIVFRDKQVHPFSQPAHLTFSLDRTGSDCVLNVS